MLSKYKIVGNGEELTEDNVRDIVKVFYPDAVWVQSLDINDDVVDVLWEMMQSARQCSRAMDFVPRPVGFRPGPLYIAKMVWQISVALSKKNTAEKRNIYMLCSKGVGSAYQSKLIIASNNG